MRLGSIALLLALVGCSLKLPDIPANHPGSVAAASGQMYATPAVLEVRALVRPPDRPMTRPAHPYSHQSEDMTPMGEMPRHPPGASGPAHEHEVHDHTHNDDHPAYDVTQTMPGPAGDHEAAGRRQMQGKRQQKMIREGQLHE